MKDTTGKPSLTIKKKFHPIFFSTQYMTDTHLDEVYHDFLLELATGEYYPPNPYPRLVSMLRQQAMK